MKKRLVIIVCILAAGMFIFRTQRPYKDLAPSDITSATVHLSPPDKTIQITETEIEGLVPYLKEITIYHKDDSYYEYNGQAVTFTLSMTDGSKETIVAYAPFVVIDGTGYKAKYAPCEGLNNYANKLLHAQR
ncbi:hypothetical protein [Pseudoflavonifractor sp. MSJ-37]|uniref:hypothetical protein n=1 Tax=Pseudoflavonifractor sp. MSJ-37 TaxID=2841531 RepID=UPI001C0FD88A|nr:hypothetical protein [Pseudoflavonifractor sp. MSJ-37]MBU5434250.1 hypothetical protein [Pseudoflavonifractor sp. MSJ-37]